MFAKLCLHTQHELLYSKYELTNLFLYEKFLTKTVLGEIKYLVSECVLTNEENKLIRAK